MAAIAFPEYGIIRSSTGQPIPLVMGFNNCWRKGK